MSAVLYTCGIPATAFNYRLGNRSALDRIIDQYRVKTDKRSGIVNDPSREDVPQYMVRLLLAPPPSPPPSTAVPPFVDPLANLGNAGKPD